MRARSARVSDSGSEPVCDLGEGQRAANREQQSFQISQRIENGVRAAQPQGLVHRPSLLAGESRKISASRI
jgi:hypothetical protein